MGDSRQPITGNERLEGAMAGCLLLAVVPLLYAVAAWFLAIPTYPPQYSNTPWLGVLFGPSIALSIVAALLRFTSPPNREPATALPWIAARSVSLHGRRFAPATTSILLCTAMPLVVSLLPLGPAIDVAIERQRVLDRLRPGITVEAVDQLLGRGEEVSSCAPKSCGGKDYDDVVSYPRYQVILYFDRARVLGCWQRAEDQGGISFGQFQIWH